MKAGLANLNAETLDHADAEAFADQIRQRYAPHSELPSSATWLKPDIGNNFLFDKSQCRAGSGTVRMKCRSSASPFPATARADSASSSGPSAFSPR